ncbi:MAG: hypothetical protein ACE5IR_01390 [bacterium]
MDNPFAHMKTVNIYPPSITTWNRLEGRPRTEDFDRALKAEVRDALWMISKQWQMGEFMGDDAGSPVLAKAHMATTALTKYQPGEEAPMVLEQDIPLEVKVEHQKIPFHLGQQAVSLDLRLLMGRQWLKWIAQVDASLKSKYIEKYSVPKPDPTDEADAQICAHVKVWQQFAAVAERRMDGYRLYQYLKEDAGHHAYDDIDGVDTDEKKDAIDELADKYITWYERLYYQPLEQKNPSWKPAYLEHQFSCSAPQGDAEKVLTADEYYHGRLDWYNLDIDKNKSHLEAVPGQSPTQNIEGGMTHSLLPTSVTFGGMPHPRWWTFENWKTNLGFIKPDTTDLNKLLLFDFALVYSNDWFLVPFTLPVGSLTNVKGLMVTNVFGERTWVEAAGSGPDEDWQRWNMFSLNIRGTEDVPADMSLVMLPVARKVLEGKPTEEIIMVRDEIANMVWGVESTIPLATGKSKSGKEAGYELKTKLQQLLDGNHPAALEIDYHANIRYQVVNNVPEQWIPFVPVHIDKNKREIQLQRAALPRILENDPNIPKKTEPRTTLLREGLDRSPPLPYFIHEEEISRAGVRIHTSFQRTRWYNGKVYNWLGIRKQVGRGEGRSGLAFDQIIPVAKAE